MHGEPGVGHNTSTRDLSYLVPPLHVIPHGSSLIIFTDIIFTLSLLYGLDFGDKKRAYFTEFSCKIFPDCSMFGCSLVEELAVVYSGL